MSTLTSSGSPSDRPSSYPAEPSYRGTETFDQLTAFVSLADEAERDDIPVVAPFSGEVIGTVPVGTATDVTAAVDRARTAQPDWASRPVRDRAAVLRRFRNLVLDREEYLSRIIGTETGKPRYFCFGELFVLAEIARYYARQGPRSLGESRRRGSIPGVTAIRVRNRPVGVVGIIGPWNVPLELTIGDALPALLAGNAVVIKPAEETPFSALAGAKLLYEAGLPRDVLQVVTGTGEETGGALVDAVDYVLFTGGSETGRRIGQRAGRRGIGYTLELGGKNPMVVLADADLDATLEGMVQGCFGNAGQVCLAPERLYVEDAIYDAFVDAFVERTRRLSIGGPFDYSVEVGALISEAHLEKVAAHVDDAVTKGATVLTGGRARPDIGPTVYEPTVLVDVTPEMRVFAEETFGPVVAVYRVSNDEEAVERANDTTRGLNASVWTGNRRRGAVLARLLDAGMVSINDAYTVGYTSLAAPMGGMKHSGVGRRHGPEGLTKFTVTQTVARNRGMDFLPAGDDAAAAAKRLSRMLRLFGRLPGLR
jgi:acyl-CoA reductase-like NAD-dependent aldehyde dehydrogenase